MTTGRSGAVIRQLQTLLTLGTLGDIPDDQLLDRFLSGRDGSEGAFEVLVARHGPAVLAACRSVLRDANDVEDAFQATFLVLVKRAGAIRKRGSIGCWLHGVARRVAVRVKHDAARRRVREAQARPPHGIERATTSDLHALLHDAIDRLPEKYRAPVILCDLEGRSHAEAADALRWPIGTVSGRLSRARDLLRNRLVGRGVRAGVVVAALGSGTARAAVPASLIRRTTQAALLGTGSVDFSMLHGPISGAVLQAGLIVRTRLAASVALWIGLGGLGTGHVAVESWEPSTHVATRIDTPASAATPRSRLEIAGLWQDDRVTSLAFAPDGRTLASGRRDATVTLWDVETGSETRTLKGHTGAVVSLAFAPDGRTLTSGAEDRTMKIWDVATGRETLSVSWCPDGAHPLVLDSGSQGPDRSGSGRDRSADGPGQPACS